MLDFCYSLSAIQVVDVVVDHKSSSRVHACIAFDVAGDPFLVDLGSAHGVIPPWSHATSSECGRYLPLTFLPQFNTHPGIPPIMFNNIYYAEHGGLQSAVTLKERFKRSCKHIANQHSPV